MDKLKPCPFCMSDNIRVLSVPGRDEYDPQYYTSVRCSDCSAGIIRESDESADHAFRAAVESWNRRAHSGDSVYGWRMMEKKGPFQEIEIQKPEMIGEFAIVNKFSAMVTDAKDQAVYNAIIDAAKKAGINSLLLMDRRFVLNALEVAIKRKETFDSCSKAPTIEDEPVVRCKDWRCWAEKPTEEERRAAEWRGLCEENGGQKEEEK